MLKIWLKSKERRKKENGHIHKFRKIDAVYEKYNGPPRITAQARNSVLNSAYKIT